MPTAAARRLVCRLSQRLAPRPTRPYGRGMPSDAPTVVRISASHNRVEVIAKKGATFRLEGSAEVSEAGGQITVSNVHSRLRVHVPADSDLVIGTTSGRIEVTGRVGHLAIVTESGRVEVDAAASIDIRTESSRVALGDVAGVCRIRSGSGRVEVKSCGRADIAGDRGRIELHNVDGEVDAHSVSGRIELSMASANDVRAETVTGRIEVSLPKGTVAYQPIDVSDRTLRPPGCDCTVIARSTSGKVVVEAR